MPSFKRNMEIFPRHVARIECANCGEHLETSPDEEDSTPMQAQQRLLKECKEQRWGFDDDDKPLCETCYENYLDEEDEDE